MKNPLLSGRTSCAIFLLGFTNLTLAQNVQPGLEEMWELIQQQQAQIEALQQELGQQEEQIEENTLIATTAIDAAETFSDRGDSNQWYDRVSLGGYAEHHYNIHG